MGYRDWQGIIHYILRFESQIHSKKMLAFSQHHYACSAKIKFTGHDKMVT